MANRIKLFLQKLISHDRTGFINNRFTGENIRLTDGVIKYTVAKNIPGLLLFLDFEKAFDTPEWPFIQRTLQHFGFGLSFQSGYKYSIKALEVVFGRAIDFKLTREVRQGCPLSPYLFVFLAEIMAENVRKTKEIRGLRPAPRNYHPTSSGAFWPRPLKYSRNRGVFCHGTNDEMAFSEVVSRIWRPCLFSAIRNRYSNKSKTFHRVCVLKF